MSGFLSTTKVFPMITLSPDPLEPPELVPSLDIMLETALAKRFHTFLVNIVLTPLNVIVTADLIAFQTTYITVLTALKNVVMLFFKFVK